MAGRVPEIRGVRAQKAGVKRADRCPAQNRKRIRAFAVNLGDGAHRADLIRPARAAALQNQARFIGFFGSGFENAFHKRLS